NVTEQSGGTYTVTPTSDKGCEGEPVQTVVTVKPKIVATISSSTAICAGASTQLQASGGTSYQWTPSDGLDRDDIANPVASPTETTTYTVKIGNGGCYDDSKSVTITVYADPFANAGSDKVLFSGQSVKLDGSVSGDNITSAYWTPADYLSDPNSLTPTANPPHDMTYTLYA